MSIGHIHTYDMIYFYMMILHRIYSMCYTCVCLTSCVHIYIYIYICVYTHLYAWHWAITSSLTWGAATTWENHYAIYSTGKSSQTSHDDPGSFLIKGMRPHWNHGSEGKSSPNSGTIQVSERIYFTQMILMDHILRY